MHTSNHVKSLIRCVYLNINGQVGQLERLQYCTVLWISIKKNIYILVEHIMCRGVQHYLFISLYLVVRRKCLFGE